MNTYASHERIYTDGEVNGSISNATGNIYEALAQTLSWIIPVVCMIIGVCRSVNTTNYFISTIK
jgi:hypothetical protein